MKRRAIKVQQLGPGEMRSRFAIVPVGLYVNKQLQRAEAGSVVEFQADWRRDRFVLVRKAKVAVDSSVFSLLLKSVYGEGASWRELAERWRAQCIIEGLGKDAFSESEVLLLEVRDEGE